MLKFWRNCMYLPFEHIKPTVSGGAMSSILQYPPGERKVCTIVMPVENVDIGRVQDIEVYLSPLTKQLTVVCTAEKIHQLK